MTWMSVKLEGSLNLSIGEGVAEFMGRCWKKVLGILKKIGKMKMTKRWRIGGLKSVISNQKFYQGHGGHGADYQPLDKLIKRMKVDVPNFY